MFRIALCDDCPFQTEALLSLLNSYQSKRTNVEIKYRSFLSGQELITGLQNGLIFDLFLLDILMPDQNGIDLAKDIRLTEINVPIVYLTNSIEHALDAFGVEALQYLVKPITTDRLFPILDRIIEGTKPDDESFIMFAAKERTIKVTFASITHVELFGRIVKIYQTNGNILESKTIRTSFDKATAPLLSDSRFLRPHKSFIINMAWVEEVTANSFIVKHGYEIPIPRYKYTEAKNKYFKWLNNQGI
jgi:DNA-binding LytR/AlgR family response regulator